MTSKLTTPFNCIVDGSYIQIEAWPGVLESFIVSNQYRRVAEAAIVVNDVSATIRDASISLVFRRARCAGRRLFKLLVLPA